MPRYEMSDASVRRMVAALKERMAAASPLSDLRLSDFYRVMRDEDYADPWRDLRSFVHRIRDEEPFIVARLAEQLLYEYREQKEALDALRSVFEYRLGFVREDDVQRIVRETLAKEVEPCDSK